MKKTYLALANLFAVFCLVNFSSCNNDQIISLEESQEVQPKVVVSNPQLRSASVQQGRFEKFEYLKAKLDAGEDIRSELAAYILEKAENQDRFGQGSDIVLRQMLYLIDPDMYDCDDETPLTQYIRSTTQEWTLLEVLFYSFYGDLPIYDAIYFTDPVKERQSYGENGEFTNQINRTFKSLKRFWNIYSEDILLVSMNTRIFHDIPRMAALIYALEDRTEEEALYVAMLLNGIFTTEAFWGGNHPLFTFNAFALSTTDDFVKDRIVMGDGILKGFAEIGLGDVAPLAILAHEFAHHVQYEKGYFDIDVPETAPEATRRTELMSDAYTGYFLTHKRGGTLNQKRVMQFYDVSFNIGDCGFNSSGHHGTPAQRLAASQWGFNLANGAHKQGHIIHIDQLYELFRNSLDSMINCPSCLANAG